MNVTQIIKRIRRSAFLEPNSVDWTDANIMEECNDVFTQLYERAVTEAKGGIWHDIQYLPLVANQLSYRLTERACYLHRVQLVSVSDPDDWIDIDEVNEGDAVRYQVSTSDWPERCVIRGEALWPLPVAKKSNEYALRVHYALRPSRMCLPQTTPADAGRITNIDPDTRVITIAAGFDSIAEDGTHAAVSGTASIDIVHPGGWHMVHWTGQASISGTSVTLASDASGLAEANDLSDLAVGDFVRAAEQTDWPPLEASYHRSVADATAAKILRLRGMGEAAQELDAAEVLPALRRFGDMLQPRVGTAAYVFVAPEFR